jgi:putative tryptophan/tyrosine transport system substrate-binding protein
MRRREFIAGLGGAAAWPLAAKAQQTGKVHRVGLIFTVPPVSDMAGPNPNNPAVRAFVQSMRALGYIEGQNFVLERRSAEGRFERIGEIIAELIDRKVDVIVAAGGNDDVALEAKRITRTVPIVMANSNDPVAAGIVASFARPGGNITGFTQSTGPEFETKRLQLFREALPSASRIAFLGLKSDWEGPQGAALRAAAQALGVTMVHAEHTPTYFADAFNQLIRDRPDAIFVPRNATAFANRQLIAGFAVEHRIPGMYAYREYVEIGGLMSYGSSVSDLFRRAAGQVDKILKGAKPADLPIEQPTKFELVVNARTAKSLGLTIPPTLLAIADEVIE